MCSCDFVEDADCWKSNRGNWRVGVDDWLICDTECSCSSSQKAKYAATLTRMSNVLTFRSPVYLGFVLGLASLGLVLGPVLGGVFTQHASWRWCFYINFPFGTVTIGVLAFIKIPDSIINSNEKLGVFGHMKRLDLPGVALFAPACTMLLLALQVSKFLDLSSPCNYLLWFPNQDSRPLLPLFHNDTVLICSSSGVASHMPGIRPL